MSKDPVTIFVPTRGRAKQLKKNMQLLKENTHYPACELIVIVDADDKDTLDVCREDKLNYIVRLHREYFATKTNAAFRGSSGKYFVCLSDDVEVQPDWLTIAVDGFKQNFSDDAGVLCFNDGGVYEGKLAIHPFISREWIDKFQYGKWILWPDYYHFYGDTEITIVSYCAGRFVYCPESKVIHTMPNELDKRDKHWWHIRNHIYPGDLAIFEKRCDTQFPGYGPGKIKMPTNIRVVDNMTVWDHK